MTSYADLPDYPLYLAGDPLAGPEALPVLDKYRGLAFASTSLADEAMVARAIVLAHGARPVMADLKAYQRYQILQHCLAGISDRRDELAVLISRESGKTIREARAEVERARVTFRLAAESLSRPQGEVLDLALAPASQAYEGQWRRFPIGLCSFITPFNFPLNLVAHKVAPAIAAGCPFILKPALNTPLSALVLGQILATSGLPAGSFSILPCRNEVALPLIRDDRIRLISFTGSESVGWWIRDQAEKKSVVLELGGVAAVVIDDGADLEDVCTRMVFGAFYQAGQSCVSLQRGFIHHASYDELKTRLIRKVSTLVVGDPALETTDMGPLISPAESRRILGWIREAVECGARVLCGGRLSADGILLPTILENVPGTAAILCQEVFGPVLIIEPFKDIHAAFASINAGRYGLQAGVFTENLETAMQAWHVLEVGGVIINDVPSWRGDNMPYGGVKDSGIGREGVFDAIEHMTEKRMLVFRRK